MLGKSVWQQTLCTPSPRPSPDGLREDMFMRSQADSVAGFKKDQVFWVSSLDVLGEYNCRLTVGYFQQRMV